MSISEIPDSIQHITSAVVAAGALFVALKPTMTAVRLSYRWFIRKEVERDAMSNLVHLQRINDQMYVIENTVDRADRVLLFSGHNCGGLPSIDKPFHITQIGRALNNNELASIGDYSSVEASAQYVRMLIDVYQNKEILFITANEADGQLKNYYIGEGVTESMIFFLRITSGKSFIYLSVATKHKDGFTTEKKAKIRHLVTTIQASANKIR